MLTQMRFSKLKQVFVAVCIAFIPLFILIWNLGGAGKICNKQLMWSDEIIHWAQVATVRETGLGGGYYTVNEVTPRIEWMPFYTWGPGTPLFYGTLAKLIGWEFCTPIILNAVFPGIAILLFILLIQPGWKQLSILAFLYASFPALIFYLPVMMLQALNIALAIVLATAIYFFITRDNIKLFHLTLVCLVVLLASTLRVTWSFLLIPLCVIYVLQHFSWKRLIAAFLFASVLSVAMMLLYFSSSAPYPNEFSVIMDRLSVDMVDGLRGFLGQMRRNLNRSFQGNIAHLILRIQVLLIGLYGLFISIRSIQRGQLNRIEMRFALVHTFSIGITCAFVLLVYEAYDWRDFRLLAPVLFLSLLLLIAENKLRLTTGLIVAGLASFIAIVPIYTRLIDVHYSEEISYKDQLTDYEDLYSAAGVRFEDDASSRWCNTILFTGDFIYEPEVLLAFDDGMGLSFLENISLLNDGEFRSQYILLPDTISPDNNDFVPVLEVEGGILYRNELSACNSVNN